MTPSREGWLHALVLVALLLVVLRSSAGAAWLPLAFPAVGVLLAAVAASCAGILDRAGSSLPYLARAGLRVLVPFWLFAAVVVPVARERGWAADEDLGSAPLDRDSGWLWVLPLAEPPVSTEALAWTTGLWLVRTVVWLVLLTPVLLWLFRRWPVRICLVPVGVLALVVLGLTNLTGEGYDLAVDLCTWTICWLLGFGYADGTLARLPLLPTLAGGALLTAAGVAWALQARTEDLYDEPVAALLISTGAVLLLLRAEPSLGSPFAGRRARAVVGFLPRRLVTVFLWAELAVTVTPWVLARTPLAPFHTADARGAVLQFATAVVLLAATAALLGWVEVLATRSRRRTYVLTGNVVVSPSTPAAPPPAGR